MSIVKREFANKLQDFSLSIATRNNMSRNMDYKTPKNKIQQNTKTRRATTQTTFGSDLIEFFGDD